MMLVVLFVLLFMAMLGVGWRLLGSNLRVESVRTLQVQRDQGSVPAIARGLTLLETGLPPSNPYVCGVDIATSQGIVSYTVTFTLEGSNNWSVQSVPTPAGAYIQPMPPTFAK